MRKVCENDDDQEMRLEIGMHSDGVGALKLFSRRVCTYQKAQSSLSKGLHSWAVGSFHDELDSVTSNIYIHLCP